MPPGPKRDMIERETNERAGGPFAALDEDERLTFLSDLATLP